MDTHGGTAGSSRRTRGRTSPPRLALAGFALVAPLMAVVPASAAAGTCDGRAATHLGTPGDDVLTGTNGDDVMVGLGGDDTISGFLGNDVICGDEGTDRLAGFAGDDRIFGGFDSDAGGDVIWPGAGNDHVEAGLDPLTRDDYSLPADTVLYSDLLGAGLPGGIRADLTPVGGLGYVAEPSGTDQIVVTEALSIVGTRAADVLIGSPYLDVLIGRGGADQIDGAGGNDTLVSDFTNTDVDPATDAPDDIDGGPGMDWIRLGLAGGTARGGEDMDHLEVHPETAPAVLRGQSGRRRAPGRGRGGRRRRWRGRPRHRLLQARPLLPVDVGGRRRFPGSRHPRRAQGRLREGRRRSPWTRVAGCFGPGRGPVGCAASRSWRSSARTSAGGSAAPPTTTTSSFKEDAVWRP